MQVRYRLCESRQISPYRGQHSPFRRRPGGPEAACVDPARSHRVQARGGRHRHVRMPAAAAERTPGIPRTFKIHQLCESNCTPSCPNPSDFMKFLKFHLIFQRIFWIEKRISSQRKLAEKMIQV
jgi:hypothetical protein